MIFLILGLLVALMIVLFLYPAIGVGLIILVAVYGIYRAVSKQRAKEQRIALEYSAEQRKNAREARLQQAHNEKMKRLHDTGK